MNVIFYSLLFVFVKANWPVFDSSIIQLAGLFSDQENTSKPTILSVHSEAMFKSAIILAQQSNLTINGQFIGWKSVHTNENFIVALNNLCTIMSNSNIIGIIGPESSRETHVIANFGLNINIPVISYAATNPDLSDRLAYPAFYRTIPSDAFAAIAITQLFIRYNWTSCVIIYQNDEFGSGGNEAIKNEFDKNGLLVISSIVFDLATASIRGDLKEILLGSPSRIVILWVFEDYTSVVLKQAIEKDVAGPRFTWILRSNISLETFNKTSYENLIGLLLIESTSSQVVNGPFNSELSQTAKEIWQTYEPSTYPQSNIINDYALYAFDATWTLLQALNRLSTSNIQLLNNSSCYEPQFVNTSCLFKEIDQTQFLGTSGPIRFRENTTDRLDGVYFVLENIQPFQNGIGFIPVLQWSYVNQWQTYTQADVIVWPGNTLQSPSGSAGLQGINLKICIIESAPFTMIAESGEPNNTKFIGYIPDLIDILQEQMGFISHINLEIDHSYNNLVMSVANSICDIAMGDITITAKRREIVDFSNAIFDNSLRVIIREIRTNDVDLFSYMRPFSLSLWFILLVSTIFAAILLCFIERKENDALKDKSLISSAAMSLWYSLGTIMGYGADFQVRTAAGRLLSVGLYLLSLVLVATYTANLASDLTIAKTKDIITGIDDIKNGKLPFSRIGIRFGTSELDYYLREISYGNHNFYPLHSDRDLYESLVNGTIDASIVDTSSGEYAISNVYCNLTIVGADFSQSAFGIVMSKNWIYSKDIDIVILSLRETGILDNLRKKWFQANVCKNTEDTTSSSFRISIQSMGGLFSTFAVICLLSILLFIWTKRFTVKKHVLEFLRRETYSIEQSD